MNPRNDAQTFQYKSKDILWTSGNGTAVFDNSFIPERGPNGGLLKIRDVTMHAILNITVAGAVIQGEDRYRAFRLVDLLTVGGVKRFDAISGDTARLISYAAAGPSRTHEHQDAAVVATTDRKFTCTLPLSKPYGYDADDTGLPRDFFKELRIGMASATDMTIGASIVTVHSGTYWLVVDCYEEMSIILPAQDVWRQVDLLTTSAVDAEIDTGGRLQDLFLFVPGANGGQTLANLTDVRILHLMETALLKDPDLKHAYARARGAFGNLFSTKGDPIRTDPFWASDSGTLRALMVKMSTGSKVFDGPERAKEAIKLTLSAALPAAARLVVRYTVPKSEVQRAALMRAHGVTSSYVKTRDKSKRDKSKWADKRALAYVPEKMLRS